MSVTFLHVTSWAAVILLAVSWAIPAGGKAGAFTGIWDQVERPFDSIGDRFDRLFVGVDGKQVRPIHSFEDFLPFKNNFPQRDRVVLELKAGEDLELANFPFLYGASYSQYSEAGWLMGDRIKVDVGTLPLETIKERLESGAIAGAGKVVETEVTVAGSRRPVLFGLGHPIAASLPSSYQLPKASLTADREAESLFISGGIALETNDSVPEGQSYRVLGIVPDVTVEDLQIAGADYPAWVTDSYLQVPGDLPERVTALTSEVTAGAVTPYEKTAALLDYLKTNYDIAFKAPAIPVGRDAVDFFLFESKEGFYDFHASALAVMLRSVGVPTRLAVGFQLDEDDAENGNIIIRDRHAFSWTEVYFPEIGWVPFTYSTTIPSGQSPLVDPLDSGQDPSDPGALDLLDDLSGDPFDAAKASEGLAESQAAGGPPLALWIPLGFLGALVLATATLRFAWERPVASLPYPQQVWEKALRLASWARTPIRPNQTPREFMRDVQTLTGDEKSSVFMAEAYCNSRFGGRQLSSEEQKQLRDAWRRLRNHLAARILQRRR